MAVCRTLKTKRGISKFLLNSEYGDEAMTAFQYEDRKVEVHALKKECAPLYFDEGTSVNGISVGSLGILLIATIPSSIHNALEIGLWDINHSLGFTPKEISHENRKENKYRFNISMKKYFEEGYKYHMSVTSDGILCILINGKFYLFCKIYKSELSNLIIVEITSSVTLTNSHPVIDALFLSDLEKLYLLLLDTNSLSVMHIENGKELSRNNVTVPLKKSKATGLSRLHKLTSSKCLVIDNLGYSNLFIVPNLVIGLKLPTSIYGHGICAVVAYKQTTEGILAICNENHTINLFLLADVIGSVRNDSSTFVKPYRVLCSQYPINSMTFVRNDQLAVASSSNELITFWGGLSTNINQ